jgi:hypothetical protein
MTGTGAVAALLQQRFRLALRRHGLERRDSAWQLSAAGFRPPAVPDANGMRQLSLFE